MVKIRLMRVGKRKQPSYRVVVADARSPRDGRFIENIGKYNPRVHPSLIDIDDERAIHWLQRGAQPSDPVKVLFQKTGIWARFTGEPPPAPSDEPSPESAAEPSSSPSVTRGVSSGDDSDSDSPAASDDDEGSAAEGNA
jgi:small subunit ribosomal protein S16